MPPAKVPAEILEEFNNFRLAEDSPVLRRIDDPEIKERAVPLVPA